MSASSRTVQSALRTHALDGVPGDFSTPFCRVLGPVLFSLVMKFLGLGTLGRLLPFGFLKNGICRILGADKPHHRAKVVPLPDPF